MCVLVGKQVTCTLAQIHVLHFFVCFGIFERLCFKECIHSGPLLLTNAPVADLVICLSRALTRLSCDIYEATVVICVRLTTYPIFGRLIGTLSSHNSAG
jgi:hypothetical protein